VLVPETPPESGSRQIFVGRANEIALLGAALNDARSGRGRLVLLSGPPGIGKSRLAAEFIEMMVDEGVLTMIGRSWEAGGAPAYWPWVQAIRSYVRSADPRDVARQIGSGLGEIATLLPELADGKPDVTSPIAAEPAADRFRLFDAIATFLRSVAEDEPLIIVLDDLQAADVPSLLLLRFITDQLAASRILVVATYRDVELTPDHALTSTLAELHRAPVTTSLTLAGLDLAEVARFLEAASGTSRLASVASTLHRQTSGNPLFLGEAFRLLKSSGGELVTSTVTRMIVPAEIRALIERRLAGLGSDAREHLEVASVFGNEFDVDSIRRFQGVSVEEILDLFGEAVRAGLVLEVSSRRVRFRFSHDLIRHTLYASLSPARRVRLHRQAAAILEEVYGDEVEDHLAELALHHFEAAPGGDAAPAVEFGRRAGDRALRTLAYEEAGRLYEMAIQALEGDASVDLREMVDLHLSLGDARVRAGDLPGAGEAFWRAAEIARRLPDARRLAQAAVGYGGRFVWARAGGDQRMVPLLQDALVLLGGEDDRLRVRLMSRLACALRSSADREYCDALSGQALDLARQIGDPFTLIFVLTGRAGAIWWPENPEERLEIGTELVSIGETSRAVEGIVDGLMIRCAALIEMGDIVAARRELDSLSRIGGPLRQAAYHWLEGAMRACFALLEGSLDEVEPWAEEMLAQAPTTPARDNVSAALFQLFILRKEQGRLRELEDTIRSASVEFAWYPIHRIALADLLARGGQQPEARQILSDLSANRFAALHRDNYWVTSLCLASEVAVGLAEHSVAAVLYDLLEPYAARNAVVIAEGPLGSVARYLGLLADMLDDLEAADRHLEAAESANRKMGAQPWLAHTLHDRAQLLIRRDGPGVPDQAAGLLEECRTLCAHLGLTALTRKLETTPMEKTLPNTASAKSGSSATFRREGEFFSVSFEGRSFQIKDMKGMRYLASLLASPGREIHVLDMVAGVSGIDPTTRSTAGFDSPADPAGEDAGAVLDRRARQAYTRRLIDLEEEIAESEAFGDRGKAESGREEKDFLLTELAAAVGLGGRDRAAVSQSERARVNVTRAIRAASNKVATYSPALGDHLLVTVHTGTFCVYRPDPRSPISWQV
jgi:hypothetical protein